MADTTWTVVCRAWRTSDVEYSRWTLADGSNATRPATPMERRCIGMDGQIRCWESTHLDWDSAVTPANAVTGPLTTLPEDG